MEKETYEAILELDGLISVKEEISGMISVTVLMEDPKLASDIANYIAEYVKSFISIEQKREAARNKVFVEKQMEDAKSQLEISEDSPTEFRKNHPLINTVAEANRKKNRRASQKLDFVA